MEWNTLQTDDMDKVQQPVQSRSGHRIVSHDFSPLTEGLFGRHDDTPGFITSIHQLEKSVASSGVKFSKPNSSINNSCGLQNQLRRINLFANLSVHPKYCKTVFFTKYFNYILKIIITFF